MCSCASRRNECCLPVSALGSNCAVLVCHSHDRVTPNTCRISALQKSAASGQEQKFKTDRLPKVALVAIIVANLAELKPKGR